ncbi:hypothetical protein H9Y04_41210 [Streptomyces sp. TRM66268-LWL]|uniref:Uncharacterized protein n=1 Tax=Streptomyces polyasparticus TaxID=2767826 RepID=A0ABR7SU14_9ACTN|nr:hypothetical protein [Streptomyces polyasparticus]MBC9718965.1 hypothetical protein [Streptomyces polyasparticus]
MPTPPPLPTLPGLPQNTAVLAFLRAQAAPPGPVRTYDIDAWELHTHPDLMERIGALAPYGQLHSAYGVPVLAYEGVAAAVALGTETLLLRLRAHPPQLAESAPCPPPITFFVAPQRGYRPSELA